MSEADENSWIKKNACDGKDFLWRVENRLFEGTFDTFAIIMKKQMWIEIKAPIEPARPTSKLFADNHKFTQGQKNFALSVTRAGGSCWGFIGTNLNQILIPADVIEGANDMTVAQLLYYSTWNRRKGTGNPRKEGEALRYALAECDLPKGRYDELR